MLTLPLYWALSAVATYKALYQLFTRPFYWEKTRHGLYKGPISDGRADGSAVPIGRW